MYYSIKRSSKRNECLFISCDCPLFVFVVPHSASFPYSFILPACKMSTRDTATTKRELRRSTPDRSAPNLRPLVSQQSRKYLSETSTPIKRGTQFQTQCESARLTSAIHRFSDPGIKLAYYVTKHASRFKKKKKERIISRGTPEIERGK